MNDFTLKILELVAIPFLTAISGLVIAVLTKKLQSMGLTVTEQQQDRLRQLAVDAIHAVEEQAHRDKTMTGPDKHDAALDILRTQLPKTPEKELVHQLDAQLPVVRVELKGPPTPPVPTDPEPDTDLLSRGLK
jgi:outer membrane biosynthesis protein TonB